jgi:hypothetical protein
MLQGPAATGGSGLRRVFGDFVFTPILRANNGRPFNLLAGTELNNDRHNTHRLAVLRSGSRHGHRAEFLAGGHARDAPAPGAGAPLARPDVRGVQPVQPTI